MKRFLLISTLLLSSTIAFCQWDDDYQTSSSTKKQNTKNYNNTGSVSTTSTSNSTSGSVTNSNSTTYSTASSEFSSNSQDALISNFDAALQRRLSAMKSTASHDESYWDIMESYYHFLRNSYDKNLYNVIALNDQVWVEPQYITAMFDGSDPAQGVNDYIEVLMKQKKREAKKKEEEQYYSKSNVSVSLSFGFGWGYPWYDPWYNPWYHSWYGPWYNPWYNPWYRPWYGPWYGPGVIVVGPAHPVYYGNSRYYGGGYGGRFSPSPSVRPSGGYIHGGGGGNPMGSGYSNARVSPMPTKSSTPQQQRQIQQSQKSYSGERSYRNNTNTASPSSRSYRSSSPSRSSSGSSYHSGYSGGGGGFGGGGFHSIGGGGRRR